MPIERDCSGCGKRLRVGDEHRGKKARCPHCNTIYVVGDVPSTAPKAPFLSGGKSVASESRESVSTNVAGVQWLMQTPEGRTYGPVSRADLDGWQRDGRISADCQLRPTTSNDWQPAATVYPQLGRAGATAGVSTIVTGTGNVDPYRPPGFSAGTASTAPAGRNVYQTPHRGVIILLLALFGWSGCPILTIVALVMSFNDLVEIKAGRMDPEGRQLTEAAKIIAIIHVTLVAMGMMFMLCMGCAGTILDA